MTSTTPSTDPPKRPSSRGQNLPSRPTTPLRPPSRSSFRGSASARSSQHGPHAPTPLESLEPAFAELSDGMADLEANFMHLQLMHESLARFSESFAAFLYGLGMNAFCVDFPEAPIPESFKRAVKYSHPLHDSRLPTSSYQNPDPNHDPDATFLTTDTSFVENPPSSKAATKFSTPAPSRIGRGGAGVGGGGNGRGGAAGGRGVGRTRGSGIARGAGRGRGGGRGGA
ncbi:hypothetical protein W97_06074 [Coniosporium apollinis CBS 100218]|uniref:DASH complex subunit DAM1 n=1 Tax=Coniosporium apollinis (strain CBS 100218) TaxID=1168221 RepID=R7YYN5_CONA1|nr:uncharacterized protein W97_06074 [Coniosporium apollinis CBS 100218]EON66958.1 hypothetical protein W97_06074 [Coniosporium apollinis CBS 100218]